MNASELKDGQTLRITNITLAQPEKQRLFFMGIYEGGYIQKIKDAPLHDPSLFYVCGNQVILRNKDVKEIKGEICL